jgi:hypothetical protein
MTAVVPDAAGGRADLLVQHAGHDAGEHLDLARGQHAHAAPDVGEADLGGQLVLVSRHRPKTVKVHRARVMEKIQAGSVAELVRLADEAGVTVPGS